MARSVDGDRCTKTGKVRLTRKLAQRRAATLRRVLFARMQAYECRGSGNCGGWHVGNIRGRSPRRRRW